MHDLSGDDEPPLIPKELFSDYTDERFKMCTRCGESLHDYPGGFQVSKAWKKGECVFEYALCDHCRNALMEEFSKESKERLSRFQDDHVQFDRGLDNCSVCGVSRDDAVASDFVLTGVCDGDHLLHGIMVCGKCGERTQELLSKPTKDTWRRFRDENFPGPPGDEVLDPVEPLSVLV
jgi:hypothetical protein